MFNKEVISEFLQTDFSDKSLNSLLSAAKKGEVVWVFPESCLVGRSDHVTTRCEIYSIPARAYKAFEVRSGWFSFGITAANKNLIPLIEREIARRKEGKELTAELLKVGKLTDELHTVQTTMS